MRLVEGLPRLDCHGTVYTGAGEFGDEVWQQEIAAQCGHAIVNPPIFGGRVVPEVVVCIDDGGIRRRLDTHRDHSIDAA
jgi:hypothetical protein